MIRILWACLVGIILAVPGTAGAAVADTAGEALAGNWKLAVTVPAQSQTLQTLTLWLIKLESRSGKWTGEVLASDEERVGKATLTDVKVDPEMLHFMLKGPRLSVPFEGKLPATATKSILGSVVLGSQTFPAQLEQTTVTSLDSYALAKDALAKETGPKAVNSATILLGQAGERKGEAGGGRGWAEKAFKSAEAYGPRYQLEVALRLARLLTQQEEFAKVAVEYARRAERLLEPASQAAVHKRVLEVLAEALTKAGQTDEAKEVEARNNKIPWVKVTPFPGARTRATVPSWWSCSPAPVPALRGRRPGLRRPEQDLQAVGRRAPRIPSAHSRSRPADQRRQPRPGRSTTRRRSRGRRPSSSTARPWTGRRHLRGRPGQVRRVSAAPSTPCSAKPAQVQLNAGSGAQGRQDRHHRGGCRRGQAGRQSAAASGPGGAGGGLQGRQPAFPPTTTWSATCRAAPLAWPSRRRPASKP